MIEGGFSLLPLCPSGVKGGVCSSSAPPPPPRPRATPSLLVPPAFVFISCRLFLMLAVSRCGSCFHPPPDSCQSWPAARMQQNGSSGSSGSFSPLPAATTRVRRFMQERRTLPLPRVMVVFSAAGDTDKPGDAMSSSDSAEDDYRKPASPTPSLTLSKPLRSELGTQEQEVGRCCPGCTKHSH